MDISRRRSSRIACASPADKAEDSLNCPRLAAAVPSVEVYPIEQGRVKGIRGGKKQRAGAGKAAPEGGLPSLEPRIQNPEQTNSVSPLPELHGGAGAFE